MKILKYGPAILLLMYLLGSFYHTTFDVSKWSEESRFVIGAITFALIMVIALGDYLDNGKIDIKG